MTLYKVMEDSSKYFSTGQSICYISHYSSKSHHRGHPGRDNGQDDHGGGPKSSKEGMADSVNQVSPLFFSLPKIIPCVPTLPTFYRLYRIFSDFTEFFPTLPIFF